MASRELFTFLRAKQSNDNSNENAKTFPSFMSSFKYTPEASKEEIKPTEDVFDVNMSFECQISWSRFIAPALYSSDENWFQLTYTCIKESGVPLEKKMVRELNEWHTKAKLSMYFESTIWINGMNVTSWTCRRWIWSINLCGDSLRGGVHFLSLSIWWSKATTYSLAFN